MTYRERLEAMADDLARHPLIEVIEHKVVPSGRAHPVGGPRYEAYIKTKVKGQPLLQKARRDPGLRAFYQEIGWCKIIWRLRRERLDAGKHAWALACEEGDHQLEGHIVLLDEPGAFDSQEGKMWFQSDPHDDPRRSIRPLDEPISVQRATVIVPGPQGLELASYVPGSRDLGDTRLRFDVWFERLLATRGMVDTLWSSPTSPDFARLRSVFDDVDPKHFQ